MKPCAKNMFLLPVLVAALCSVLGGQISAQTFTILHSLNSGSDGSEPNSELILSGNILYGTAVSGGSFGEGTVFKVSVDGTGFRTLHNFTALDSATFTNNDGSAPFGGLVLSGDILYGTAEGGGTSGHGTVFAVKTDGSDFTTLHSFAGNNDGVGPRCSLVLSGTRLYGTTWEGGTNNLGTVFSINTNGMGYAILHTFSCSDGAQPFAGLIISSNILYGVTIGGTVFRINTDGSGFQTLYNFTPLIYPTNSDGAFPTVGLLLSGDTLYGTADSGGSWGDGTVFKLHTDGTGFETLYSFTPISGLNTNSDGAGPHASLTVLGGTLYGMASTGGNYGFGTLFAINTDGTGFVALHTFAGYPNDGDGPLGGLISSSNILYGTTAYGGNENSGTVFSLLLPTTPLLTIAYSGQNVVLSWPTNYTGFALQSTTNLFSSIWTTNSAAPVVVNGQYTVTNPVSGNQQFFRLSQ